MGNPKFTNWADTEILSAISASATSITISIAAAALWPQPMGADWAPAVLSNGQDDFEIVKITANNIGTGVLTVVRGQQSTTAIAWDAGTRITNTPTADDFNTRLAADLSGYALDDLSNVDALAVTTALINNLAVTNGKIGADAIDGTKIADDSIDSEHYVADSIDTEHYAPGSVDAAALASNSVTTAKVANQAISDAKCASGFGLLPVGHVAPWPVTTLPSGWLLCDGSAVSRTTYSELNAVMAADGYEHGNGDGSTTFNLPDYRGAFLRGTGTSGISAGTGPSVAAVQAESVGIHAHDIIDVVQSGAASEAGLFYNTGLTAHADISDGAFSTGTGIGTENRPPNVGIKWIIFAGV